MHDRAVDPDLFLFTVLSFGVGGSVLALLGIWLEMRLGRRARLIFGGAFSFVLGSVACLLWVFDQPLGVVSPFLALAAACLAAFALQAAFVRRWSSRILQPWAIWVLLLVVSPIFAVGYAYHVSKPDPLPPLFNEPTPTKCTGPMDPRALTDLGRKIELFHYEELKTLESIENSVLEAERYAHEVIRIEGPNSTSNCHGWVFTGGSFGVLSEQVDTILAENGYEPVAQPEAGDLVIYRDDSGHVMHTGVLRFVGDDGVLLVESKWGPLGVFLHAPETQPYGQQFGFWRSPRLGHRLHLTTYVPREHRSLKPEMDERLRERNLSPNLSPNPSLSKYPLNPPSIAITSRKQALAASDFINAAAAAKSK